MRSDINPKFKANDPNWDVQYDHGSIYYKKIYKFDHNIQP